MLIQRNMTKITPGLKRIGAVVYTDCVALDLTGPIEAFNYVNLLACEMLGRSDCGYQIELIGAKAGPVTTMSTVKLYAEHGFADFDQPLNMLLVPGMTAGIDLALSIIEEDYGRELALERQSDK